jgi:hypothetical protein
MEVGCPRNKQTKILVWTETRSVSVVKMRFLPWNQKQKILVCYVVSNLYQNNWNKQNCFETNQNNPKFSEKYQNVLSIKLLRFVFCLFRFNRKIETLFWFRTETTETNCLATNQNKPKQPKIFFLPKYALCHNVSVALLFVSVQSKHRNCPLRYRTETNVLFWIVPKLVAVPISVVSNRN